MFLLKKKKDSNLRKAVWTSSMSKESLYHSTNWEAAERHIAKGFSFGKNSKWIVFVQALCKKREVFAYYCNMRGTQGRESNKAKKTPGKMPGVQPNRYVRCSSVPLHFLSTG